MNKYTEFESFLSALENINGTFVIKDFVGFLNWEPNIGAILLPYTGHHSLFCQSVKSNSRAYHRCVTCSNYIRRMCMRRNVPFYSTCFLGVSEYNVPILIDDFCIGVISVGNFCEDFEMAGRKIEALAARCGMDAPLLLSNFKLCVAKQQPSENCHAVYQFVAAFLALTFSPYFEKNQFTVNQLQFADTCFERIRHYIFEHYTDPNINRDVIAKACHYSPSSVSHIFNNRMKMNIRTYINHLRIVLAKKELRGGASIASTAMTCGFNESGHFSITFRNLVGITPSQYAKNITRH